MKNSWNEWTVRSATTAGAEATFRFTGTGTALGGTMTQSGGRANTHDNALWHVTGLAPGDHTVRLVTRTDRDARSGGTEVVLEKAVEYGR